ncbi:MAG: hypothetical protein ACPGVG_05650 [Mycobacterium sp.]
MAGSTIQGLGGSVTLPSGWNFKVASFSFGLDIATEETTGFEDGGFETHEPVSCSWNGSATGTLTYNAASTAPIPAALADGAALAVGDLQSNAKGTGTFQSMTGCTLAGTVVVTNMPITRGAKTKANVTLNMKGTGFLTQVHDETA